MSRIQRKIEMRKKKRQLTIFLFLIFIFMLLGIISVDLALREMLALDGTRVLGYEFQSDYLVFHIAGEKIYIQNERIEELQVKIETIYDNVSQKIKQLLQNIIYNRGQVDDPNL